MNILHKLVEQKIATPPEWLTNNIQWLVTGGSISYGTVTDYSDKDLVGWGIPPKRFLLPHTEGLLIDFDPLPKFEQYQQHHMMFNKVEYDVTVYNLVKYVKLLEQGNPNLVDTLFVDRDCVLHSTMLGEKLRENRHLFLSKQMAPRFLGYAYSQKSKMIREPKGKRKELVEEFGFDLKFASHLVRLVTELEQILVTGDLNLRLHSEHLKAIRRGEVSYESIINWFNDKEKQLEQLKLESNLPQKPDHQKIKTVLLEILEQHYGNLDLPVTESHYKKVVEEIRKLVDF